MKLNPIPFSLAGSLTLGLGYTLFTFFLYYYPRLAFRFIAITHFMPKLEIMRHLAKVTLPMFMISIASIMVISFVFLWIFITIYNLFQK